MMALLGKEAGRDRRQQRQSLLNAQQLSYPSTQCRAMPSLGTIRGPELLTVRQKMHIFGAPPDQRIESVKEVNSRSGRVGNLKKKIKYF